MVEERMKEKMIDPTVLESLRELSEENDPNFIREYFQAVLDQMPENIKKLKIAIKAEHHEDIEQAAHAIKSSCLNAGINMIADLSQEIESNAKNLSIPDASTKCQKIQDLYERLKQEVYQLDEFLD